MTQPEAPLVVNGWSLFAHPLFLDQIETLLPKLREVLHKHCGFNSERMYGYWPLYDQGATVAILRLELFSGANSETLTRWQRGIAHLLMTEWAKSVLAQVIPNPSTTAMLVQRAAFDQCAEVLLERIAAGAG